VFGDKNKRKKSMNQRPEIEGHDSAESLKERLVERYSNIDQTAFWHKFQLLFKRAAWVAVVRSAYLFKRLLDIAAAGVLLVLLSPLFAGVIIAIRRDSPGPVFFKQIRVGRFGVLFPMWKFRSMYIDAEARKQALLEQNEMNGGVLFKMKADPRITKVGRFIRKASIDELPQLWNVLKGDMSLVGPRPALPSEVNQYSLAERRRLEVIPGITCIWQVSGRSDIPFDQQVGLDVKYIESQSFWLDVKLLLLTVPAVVLGRGAY
jgi:lipopolysaccharide/colanic/teichoic acid biosynthesis glycosyltransferase